MIGVYWGRFNPQHKGHIGVINRLLKKVDMLIIAIGSAEFQNTKRNPFNGDMKRVKIIPVSDGKSHSTAVKNLFGLCQKFDLVFLSAEKGAVSRLIESKVKVVRFKRTGTTSSTKIRNAIAKDKKWQHMTGKSVAKLIQELNGTERIKKSYRMRK